MTIRHPTFINLPPDLDKKFDNYELATLFALARKSCGEFRYYNAYDHTLNIVTKASRLTSSRHVISFSAYPQAKLAGGLPEKQLDPIYEDNEEDGEDGDEEDEEEEDEEDDAYGDDVDGCDPDYNPPRSVRAADIKPRSPRLSRARKLVKVDSKEPVPPKQFPDFVIISNLYQKAYVLSSSGSESEHESTDSNDERSQGSNGYVSGEETTASEDGASESARSARPDDSQKEATPAEDQELLWCWTHKEDHLHSIWEIKYLREVALADDEIQAGEAAEYFLARSENLRQLHGHIVCAFTEFPEQTRITLFLAIDIYVKSFTFKREDIPEDLTVDSLQRMNNTSLVACMQRCSPGAAESKWFPIFVDPEELDQDANTNSSATSQNVGRTPSPLSSEHAGSERTDSTGYDMSTRHSKGPNKNDERSHSVTRLSPDPQRDARVSRSPDPFGPAHEVEAPQLVYTAEFSGENGSWTRATDEVIDYLLDKYGDDE